MRSWAAALGLIAAVLIPPPAHAAGPYPVNSCAGDRVENLKCTANDLEIARLEVVSGPTTCVAGEPITLTLQAFVAVNTKNRRYDLGLFLAKDGRSPVVPSRDGGSADCAVYGFPQSPPPFVDLDGNACGDVERGTAAGGTQVAVDLGTVTYTCVPDAAGHLRIPAVITWQQNSSTCDLPAAAWVEPGGPPKCETSVLAPLSVLVRGRIVVTKQTAPDGEAGVFSFTATGPDVSPTAFSLADAQSQTVVTAPLGSTPQAYTIAESSLSGWDATAQISCLDTLGHPASFVAIDNAGRTLTAHMSVTHAEAFCTVANQKLGTGSITIEKAAAGGDGTFAFSGSTRFAITTTGGGGSQTFSELAPGSYTVIEEPVDAWTMTGLTCHGAATPPVISIPDRRVIVSLAAGDNVVCTFANTKAGAITVKKVSVGADASFDFLATGGGLLPFSILTAGGEGTHTFPKLLPGVYTVTESTPVGWTLTDVRCTGTAIPATITGGQVAITLGQNEGAVCTFTNTKQGSLTIDKLARGGDGTFLFAATGTGVFAIGTSGNVGQQILLGLAPGSYTVDEADIAGWNVTGVHCRGTAAPPVTSVPDRRAIVTLAAGEDAVCSFVDTKAGSITIKKTTGGGDASFGYTTTGAGLLNFTIATAGGAGQHAFFELAPGPYSITESAPSGFLLTDIRCTGTAVPAGIAGGTATLTLAAGESAECTYTNTKQGPTTGSLSIVKLATGGDASFDFATSGPGLAPFAIQTDSGGGTHAVAALTPGSYSVTESIPGGWTLTSLQCKGTAVPARIAGATATVTLAAGENAVCTYIDVKQTTLTIAKVARGGDGAFPFTVTGTDPFTIATSGHVGARVLSGLMPGTYRVAEAAVSGWTVTEVICRGSAVPPTISVADRRATVTMTAGENVVCTFTNTRPASLTIDKQAAGGDATFKYTASGSGLIPFVIQTTGGAGSQVFASLTPGFYSVTELVPSGWTLAGLHCTGPAVPATIAGATAALTLRAGENAVCTFTNVRSGSLTIRKSAVGGDAGFSYQTTGPGLAPFTITTAGGAGTRAFTGLAPGLYSVTETIPSGWSLTDIHCTGTGVPASIAGATASLMLAAGEQASCTYTDVVHAPAKGSLTINALAAGGDTTFRYTAVGPGLSNFTIPTVDGVGTRAFADLGAGTYSVTELIPTGWTLIGIRCTGTASPAVIAGPTATLALALGENAVCTYLNGDARPDVTGGTLIIKKVTDVADGTFRFAASGIGPFTITTVNRTGQQTYSGLAPDTYTVIELPQPGGWSLTALACVDPTGDTSSDAGTGTAVINLAAGEAVVCTFTNHVPAAIPTLSPSTFMALAVLLLGVGGWWLRGRQPVR